MNFIVKVLNFIASVIFNLRAFPWETAKKLPIKIAYNTKVDYIRKGCIEIEGNIQRSMIKIGVTGLDGVTTDRRTYIRFGKEKSAKVVFKGMALIAKGALLSADKGVLIFGKNFSANNNFYVSCNDRIEFGDNAMLGWEVKVRDSDNHTVLQNGEPKANHAPVKIGNNVWVASYCDILKGAELGDNSILGYRSLLTKAFPEQNCMIAGAPAKYISGDIKWKM